MSETISLFIEHNYRHFNAAALKRAAQAYKSHIEAGGKMLLAMGGAMSTAELGVTLADMIRSNNIHAISCTGANLEEDIFNLVAHRHYRAVPHYRHLTPHQELRLFKQKLNRVTDTCIPEEEAMRCVETVLLKRWRAAHRRKQRKLPHEFLYEAILDGDFTQYCQINPRDSWLLAAAEKKLPIFVPGWEDSTLGNVFAARCIEKQLSPDIMKDGVHYMMSLADWYQKTARRNTPGIGFFQIGGGISGDFPICVVPMLNLDL
ncbi:MAG TPA: deoxyhypusine synthase family protein, partial [Elusimicrobiales bacterium]|nr:deoxyhypusine synthase family protein [Elusimicrobiales bacterium]